MEVCFGSPDMAVSHQTLNRPKVVAVVQKGRGADMPHNVKMDSLLDQRFFYHGFDEAVN